MLESFQVKHYISRQFHESKTMKKFLLTACFGFSVLFSLAQSSVAIVGGLNGNTLKPDLMATSDTTVRQSATSTTRLTFGLMATVPITKILFFQAGVLYTAKGSNQTFVYDTTNLVAKTAGLPEEKRKLLLSSNGVLKLNYIDLPINLVLKVPIGGSTKFVLGGGPQLSLLYNGSTNNNSLYVSQKETDSSVRYTYKETVNNDLPVGNATERYRVLHFGARGFAGLEFGRVAITANYTRDLTGFYEENKNDYKAETIGASISIYLGKRERGSGK